MAESGTWLVYGLLQDSELLEEWEGEEEESEEGEEYEWLETDGSEEDPYYELPGSSVTPEWTEEEKQKLLVAINKREKLGSYGQDLLELLAATKLSGDPDLLVQQLEVLQEHLGSGVDLVQAISNMAGEVQVTSGTLATLLMGAPSLAQLAPSELTGRIANLASMLQVAEPEAILAAEQNPVLLVIPQEDLRKKLRVLSTTTGLSALHASQLVTIYMFPQLRP